MRTMRTMRTMRNTHTIPVVSPKQPSAVASRGSGGGVRLARPAAAISVANIIEAVEGPIALTSCVAEGRHDCSLEGSCKVQPHWGVVNGAVRGALAEISLASLTVAPTKSNPFVSSEVETPLDSARPKGLPTSLEANGILQ